jgi:hypothetical protein
MRHPSRDGRPQCRRIDRSSTTIGLARQISDSRRGSARIAPHSDGKGWWAGRESNPHSRKTADLQSAELTTCSTYPRIAAGAWCVADRGRSISKAVPALNRSEAWSRGWESNPQPSVYKTDALPLSYLGAALSVPRWIRAMARPHSRERRSVDSGMPPRLEARELSGPAWPRIDGRPTHGVVNDTSSITAAPV